MAVCSRVSHAEAFEGVLQGQAVEDGGEHAHVVGGGFLDDVAAGGELGAAEDVAAADDDGELHAALPARACRKFDRRAARQALRDTCTIEIL